MVGVSVVVALMKEFEISLFSAWALRQEQILNLLLNDEPTFSGIGTSSNMQGHCRLDDE